MKRYLYLAVAIHAAFTLSFLAQDAYSKAKVDYGDEINYLKANMIRGMKAHNLLADLVIKAIIPEIQEHGARIEALEKKLSAKVI